MFGWMITLDLYLLIYHRPWSQQGGGGAVKAFARGFLSITNSVFIGQQAQVRVASPFVLALDSAPSNHLVVPSHNTHAHPQGFGGAVFASTECNTSPNFNQPPNAPPSYPVADLTVIIRGCEFRRNQVGPFDR